MGKPIIAITMGDPAGIGPEIVAKALVSQTVMQTADCVVIGGRSVMERAAAITGVPLRIHVISSCRQIDHSAGTMNLIDVGDISPDEFAFGKISSQCGKAAYDCIAKSIALALAGEVDAVATAPINKESLHAAGVPYIGHTEIFGALTGVKDPLTMFECCGLRVFFLTRHVSMRKMLDMITRERIEDYADRCLKALKQLGVSGGMMAVAGLNPHCGEHGLFGDEEVKEIIPAVAELQKRGYPVVGPIGADSVFHQAKLGKYSCVLSLYHDQGHIATKTLDFDRTIAITAGMPILRTSVDHGTAFDIAGTGKAGEVSMIEAIRLAALYAPFYKQNSSHQKNPEKEENVL